MKHCVVGCDELAMLGGAGNIRLKGPCSPEFLSDIMSNALNLTMKGHIGEVQKMYEVG